MKPSERNEINNKKLTEVLANTALKIMVQGEDYEDLAGTTVKFGYLFDIDNHGIEALFKIITDKTTAYFTIQGEKMMRLNFNEELFQSTTANFLHIHE